MDGGAYWNGRYDAEAEMKDVVLDAITMIKTGRLEDGVALLERKLLFSVGGPGRLRGAVSGSDGEGLMTPKNGWWPMDTAPRNGDHIMLYIAGRGAFEGWWHKSWLHDEQYWMDDQDSEPNPIAWRPLLPGPFEDHIAEPRGCPTPGACSCPNIAEAA